MRNARPRTAKTRLRISTVASLLILLCACDPIKSKCPASLDLTPPEPASATVALCGPDASYWVGVGPMSVLYPEVNAAIAARCGDGGLFLSTGGPNPSYSPYFCSVFDGGVPYYSLCQAGVQLLVSSILDGGDCSNPLPMLSSAPGCVPLPDPGCGNY